MTRPLDQIVAQPIERLLGEPFEPPIPDADDRHERAVRELWAL